MTEETEETAQTITLAYTNGDCFILGYESWSAYCESELGTALSKVHAEIRHAWIPVLSDAGMKTGEIAAVCGTDRKTIQRDKQELTATNVAPPGPTTDPEYSTPILQGEIHTHTYKARFVRIPVGGECACSEETLATEQELDKLAETIKPYLDKELTAYLMGQLTE